MNPIGLGQNARTTGGAGILPAAILQPGSVVFLPAQDIWAYSLRERPSVSEHLTSTGFLECFR
jgi:hypothetical protein